MEYPNRNPYSAPDVPRVHRKPIKDEVYDVLHQQILAGNYGAGAWLRQEEIASHLGVSMTPVREALDLLVSSGLAERVPYRGVRVLEPATPDILNSYSVRLLLEPAASYAAACNITDEQLAGLRRLLERSRPLVALEDMPQERSISRELHSAVVSAAGNALLHKIYLTVLNTFPDWMLYEHLYRHPDLLEDSMRNEHLEHTLIVDALSLHDVNLAVHRTIEHVVNRGRELETYLAIPGESLRAREAHILPLFTQFHLRGGNPEKELS